MGFSLGLERTGGFETVAFCEIEEFPRRVLAKHWPDVPCHKDVRELRADAVGHIDLICGGYPCQPFSHAGKRQGAEDDRHLWPEVARLVATIRPTWCLFENVAGHISMGLDEVLSDLEGEGYTCWPIVIPACAVDAPHRRDRVWVVANAGIGRCGQSNQRKGKQPGRTETERPSEDVANTTDKGSPGRQREPRNDAKGITGGNGFGRRSDIDVGGEAMANASIEDDRSSVTIPYQRQGTEFGESNFGNGCHWSIEPAVGRVAHGVPRRVDRLKALGNAVVPQVVEMIGHAILESERMNHVETIP